MRNVCFLLLCLFASTSFAQVFEHKLDIRQVSAINAKSASIESLNDTIAVFLVDRIGEQQGLEIEFATSAKFCTVRVADAGHVQQKVTKSKTRPNIWFVLGKPGKYFITIIESDPEKGLDFIDDSFVVVAKDTPVVDPDKPDPDEPQVGFESLVKVSKDSADKLNDPATRKGLFDGYKSALATTENKTFEETKLAVTAARFAVLNARKDASREVPWDQWRLAVDAEMAKLVPIGDVTKYRLAINSVAEGLK
jgi:hypothetical protein